MHENADGVFKNRLVTAFNLANKASKLFENSNTSKKKRIDKFCTFEPFAKRRGAII